MSETIKACPNGAAYDGIEWFACWLLDHAEGEVITEEQLRPWAIAAWEAHLKRAITRHTPQEANAEVEKIALDCFTDVLREWCKPEHGNIQLAIKKHITPLLAKCERLEMEYKELHNQKVFEATPALILDYAKVQNERDKLRAECEALRKRLSEHDGCSRWGLKDAILLSKETTLEQRGKEQT